MMKTKTLALGILILAVVGIVFIYFQEDLLGQQPVELEYKGVWMPTFGSLLIPDSLLPEGLDTSLMQPIFADLDKAEQSGINTLAFQMGYWVDSQGELSKLPGMDEFFISFIDEAHARGFKIWLNPEIIHSIDEGGPSELRIMPEDLLENTDLIENFELGIIEMAEFAEEHNVEIFSPSSEMHVNIGRERSKRLLAEIKPRIDAVYSGKICLRGEWPIPELSSYSCFGPTIGIPKNEQEKNNLINQIENAREQNIELMLGEIYKGHDWSGTGEDARRGFAMAFEAGKDRVSGVFILDIPRPFLDPEDFESMIREFYT